MTRSSMFTSVFFALIAFTIFTSQSHAQTTINVACDTAALTAAINTANGTPETDTLNLAVGCAYNFTVGDAINTDSALPLITSPIIINGNGATIARTGGPNFRLFFIHSGGNLTLNDALISGGSEGNGGGIVVNVGATTKLTNTTISGNSASVRGGGVLVESGALLTLVNSTVSGNSAGYSGGGINNSGTLNVIKSALTGNNAATYGGGIYNNGGSVSVVNTSVAGSSANNGAGIYSAGGLTLTNATLSGNSANSGAGLYVASGSATLFNSTLAGNSAGFGGGIFILSASVTVVNSIIWGNNQAVYNNSGSFTINFSDIQGGASGAGNWNTDPWFVNPVSPASAPTTAGDYHLQSTSSVVNMGNAAALPADSHDLDGDGITAEAIPYDRDGETRIMLGNVDIGADEMSPCLAFTSPYTVSAGDEAGLVFAITCANANPDSNIINLTSSTYSFTVGDALNSDSALPRIMTPITINGNGATFERAGGSPGFRLLYVHTSGSLTLDTVSIMGGNSANGGGIYNDGMATLTNSTLSGNTATNGGGIYSTGGATLTVTGSTFSGNSAVAGGAGGSISSGGTLKVTGSTFSGNSASYGSGIYMDGTATVTSSTFSGNSAASGGAIYNNGGATLTVTNCNISGNSANTDGGGIVSGGVLTVANSTLSGNKAGLNGGGIYSNNAGTLTVINSTLASNNAPFGGGINSGGTLTLTNTIVWGNNTQIQNGGTITVTYTDIQGGFTGTGNLAADPLFVSPLSYTSAPTAAGDYHLQANSPALNVGSNASLPDDTFDLDGDSDTAEALPVDLDGNPRIVNATVDTGAFEHQVAAEIIVSETGTEVTEGGASDTYTVQLASRPATDVTLDISSGGQATANPDLLIFTPLNWSVEQTVAITAVDDDIVEGAHDDTITHNASSTDAAYNGFSIGSMPVAITDNDTAGVKVSVTMVNVSEGGVLGNYTVVLNSEPTADVIVTPTGDLHCTVSGPLTFTGADWDTAQPVTVTAIDDDVAEVNQTCTITHASVSSDTNYSGIVVATVTGVIADDDIAGVQINVTSVDVSESGTTGIYTIVLKSEPTADVIVTPTGDLQCSVSAPLTFTSGDWDMPQPVTVTAIDDDVAEGEHNCTINNIAGGSDLSYGNIPIAGVNGTITDNDTVGVTVAPLNVIVAEGGITALYAVSLHTQPTANVTITPTGDTDCAVSSQVTFNSTNWMNTQDIVVTAVDDAIAEGSHGCLITNAASSSDIAYNSILVSSVSGTVSDNDTAGVNVAPTTIHITEGGATATFAVSLTSQPTSAVTVTPTGDADCSVSPPLAFTSGNWMTAQNITVTAVNDSIAEGSHSCAITNAATSGDPNYSGATIASVSGTVTDNDTAGVNVAPTTIHITEGGATATFAVSLTSQPTSAVTVTPTGDADCSVSTGLVFTSGNWMIAQNIIVTAIDDVIAEGAHICTVTNAATSSDGNYNGISVARVDGMITDDDALPVDLLDNGGFELHTINNKIPDGWTVKYATTDKVLCKLGKPYAGLCAFAFSGGVGEKTQLSQMVDLSAVTVGAGDTLTLSAFMKGNNTTAKTQLHLIVTYSGNPTPVRYKITVGRNATYTLISQPIMEITAAVEQIKVMFKHKSTAGRVLIDDVSLMHAPAGGRRVDILTPPEMEKFRGGN